MKKRKSSHKKASVGTTRKGWKKVKSGTGRHTWKKVGAHKAKKRRTTRSRKKK